MTKMTLLATAAALLTSSAALAKPAMWKASDADSEIWLFGSIHLLDEDTQWRSEALQNALDQADYYYYEVPTDAEAQAEIQGLVNQLGVITDGRTLNDYLEEDEIALLNRVAPSVGIDPAQLQPLKPWLAGLSIGVTAMQRAGYNPESGVERQLGAVTDDDRERFFETPEQQLRMLAGGDDDVQAASLVSTLEQLEEEPELFDTMVSTWASGDADGLNELLVTSLRDVSPELWDALIVKRNNAWVETIDELMQGDEDAVIIVGAGHLVGAEGVPAALAERGYTVERIQ